MFKKKEKVNDPQKLTNGNLFAYGTLLLRILPAGQHITPYRIGVPFSKTVHILFPAEVRYVDLGSTDIIALSGLVSLVFSASLC